MKLYKIGEFSKIANVSVKTLRYYDEINLFKPIEIDIYSQYRYYSKTQLNDLYIIKQLQIIGFTLNEILEKWNCFTDDILLDKKTEIINEILVKTENIKKLDLMRNSLNNGKFVGKNIRNNDEMKIKKIFDKEKKI